MTCNDNKIWFFFIVYKVKDYCDKLFKKFCLQTVVKTSFNFHPVSFKLFSVIINLIKNNIMYRNTHTIVKQIIQI